MATRGLFRAQLDYGVLPIVLGRRVPARPPSRRAASDGKIATPPAPLPPAGGGAILGGKAQCATCHVPPTFSERGWNIGAHAEIKQGSTIPVVVRCGPACTSKQTSIGRRRERWRGCDSRNGGTRLQRGNHVSPKGRRMVIAVVE